MAFIITLPVNCPTMVVSSVSTNWHVASNWSIQSVVLSEMLAVNLAAAGYHHLFIAYPVPQNDWSVEDNGLVPGPMCFWIPVRTLSKLPATGVTNMPGENSLNSIIE